MLLITEQTDDVKCLTESAKDGKKSYFIEGIFMQSEKVNRNGRMYEREILFNEAKRYDREYVQKSRAMGELGHPDGPSLNLERVCHNIIEMSFDGDNVIGKAKVLDTPYGKIVKNLIDDPGAFVNGIMEGKEWIWNNGVLREQHVEDYKKLITKTERKNLEEQKLIVFRDFLSKL